jgi:hypothetical protein
LAATPRRPAGCEVSLSPTLGAGLPGNDEVGKARYARTPWTTHPFTAAQDVPSGTGTTHTKCVETAHTPEMAYIAKHKMMVQEH